MCLSTRMRGVPVCFGMLCLVLQVTLFQLAASRADQRLRATSSGNALHRRSLIAPPKQISPEVTKLLENYYRQGMKQGPSLTTTNTDTQEATDAERPSTSSISARAIMAPPEDSSQWPGEPAFRRRGLSSGGLIEIWAYDVVSPKAVQRASALCARMLARTPQAIRDRMRAFRLRIAVIGTHQNLTDLPPFRNLDTTADGRLWATVRGIGPILSNPWGGVGEEDILETEDDVGAGFVAGQSVMVHEFGHAVHILGFSPCQLRQLEQRFDEAYASGAYDTSTYMMQNEFEYFAVATELYFTATQWDHTMDKLMRYDRLRRRDRGVAEMVEMAFGNNPWRFPDDCLRCRTTWAWWLEDDIRPTPTVVPYTRAAPCQVPESSCTDLAGSTSCREWQGYGYCTDPSVQQYMAENCQLSCELCRGRPARPPPPPRPPSPPSPPPRALLLECKDTTAPETCDYYATRANCAKGSTEYGWLSYYCRKSCGLCRTK